MDGKEMGEVGRGEEGRGEERRGRERRVMGWVKGGKKWRGRRGNVFNVCLPISVSLCPGASVNSLSTSSFFSLSYSHWLYTCADVYTHTHTHTHTM